MDGWRRPGPLAAHRREACRRGWQEFGSRRRDRALILEGVRLLDYSSPDEVYAHPRHLAAQRRLPELIRQLRQCSDVADGHEFQQALLAEVLTTEADRRAF